MIPLSKATIQLSTYVRDNQKEEWYDEPIYICTTECHIGDQIRDECRRRKIRHECFPCVVERSTNKMRSTGCEGYIYKIEIQDTGLKTKQLVDWAITTFNWKEMVLPPYDVEAYFVWIQPRREVSVGTAGYDMDGDYLGYSHHWV